MSVYVTASAWNMAATLTLVLSSLVFVAVRPSPCLRVAKAVLALMVLVLLWNMAWTIVSMARPDCVTAFLERLTGG